jgi:dsDNA-specific endonuclease/ATPase MutS2
MGVAAARAKQVAEQLLGSRESAKEDAKQRAGSLVDEGRRAAADVISALRKEASVLFRDLDHLEEHLRGGKGPAPAPSVSDDVPDDEAARPARKATTARAAAVKKAPAAKATAARKTVPAAKATAGASSPAAKIQGRKRAAPEKVAGAGKKATAARASTVRKAGGTASGSSSRGRA